MYSKAFLVPVVHNSLFEGIPLLYGYGWTEEIAQGDILNGVK